MNSYLVPTDEKFVEEVAKSIARDRLCRDSADSVESMFGKKVMDAETLDSVINPIFEKLWNGSHPVDETNRIAYRQDAIAAINAINLILLIAE